MLTWAVADLAAAAASPTTDWLVVAFHHPPYSKGSHDSDIEANNIDMRQYAAPVLEAAGVDVVVSGHSHSYERSMLINGHYGASTTFRSCANVVQSGGGNGPSQNDTYIKPAGFVANAGTVYVVAGSSGWLDPLSPKGPHPAMRTSLSELGSLVLDVSGSALTASFLTDAGVVADSFTIEKQRGYRQRTPTCPSTRRQA